MVTMKEIAEKANVSVATVSYVLNENGNISEETKKRVWEVVKELNYRPNHIAKSLKMQKTNTIGVIVEDVTVFNAPKIIDGINENAEKFGLSIILTNMRLEKLVGNHPTDPEKCRPLVKKIMDELISKQVDGIIYIGLHPRDVTAIIPDVDIPIVFVYCYTTNAHQHSIIYDDQLAAYEATNYLISKGHERIALISGHIDSKSAHSRYSGYYQSIKEHQLAFYPGYIKTGDWYFDSGYTLAKDLLQHDNIPTAILAMNDQMAVGAIKACNDLGFKVPADISIIGFDNREFSEYSSPKLTTISLPLQEMGFLSIQAIQDLISGSSKTGGKLTCELIERESVCTPKSMKI
ncbi:LacI family DNA-binding transcriptional regulator [Bacillus swezeyi]|uniref:LacI family transcriptional regulator n=1 Tax=Bacillus swezeyi TaxID=1925020 RepID=A0A1R1RQ71_9BACI|nr:LacI family DNA-binding transcriptional regulator [Bacillus swezeyi]MEC1262545.1 LacI family DNA-binding transcriptional regulator [Bacillus swezeyi]MED2926746.1 LacI family DNA-binding transcriptional regulator [Bacillus swezeyi]MED2943475.1 LacI family DNA-binding transcriptional regulator [Bacillus swezeyi]MED2965692.1 LacI family DNA-binding transcriptional regulator [Bacillus swezeyi]MED2978382.1 LacI family DNA-binding transcriptional regulator [Bacillus swezeyi]